MKKNLLTCLTGILLFTAPSTFSQPKFGIALGGNMSTYKGDAVESLNNIIDLTNGIVDQTEHYGFSARASADLPVSEMFSIEPGLSFHQKGYGLRGDFTSDFLKLLNANATISQTNNYIGLDALASVQPVKGFHIKFGPQVNYLVNSDVKVKANVLGFSLYNESFDVTSSMKEFETSLTGALEYEFINGFAVSAFYNHGLSPVDRNSDFKAYNRSAGITLGYKF